MSQREKYSKEFKIDAIHGEKLATRAFTKNHVFEYIEIYYNRKRLHSTIGYKTPESFEVLIKVCDFPRQDHLVNHRKHAPPIYQVSDEFNLQDKIIYSLLVFCIDTTPLFRQYYLYCVPPQY